MSEVDELYLIKPENDPNIFTPLTEDEELSIDKTEFTKDFFIEKLTSSLLQNMNNMIDEKFNVLYTQIERLTEQISDLKSQNSADEANIVYIKEISKEDAKAEIRNFFKENEGDFYPSEISEELGIKYELVWEIINELEKEGKIETGDK